MNALARKALRDLWHLRGQALAIALVIAGGVATLVMSQSTYASLMNTRAEFYRDGALADLWAPLVRAPDTLMPRLSAIPGVQAVQTRLLAPGTLALAGFGEPVRAEVVSLPLEGGQPRLNRVQLRSGRLPLPDADNEVVVGEAFASAHALRVGDAVQLTLRGRQRALRVVGIGTSPEYVYQSPPGAVFPDFKRFAVLWMNRHAMEKALGMDGAFNNVVLQMVAGAPPAPTIAALDALLARYGGVGAYGRHEQTSARYLEEEMRQLRTMARLFPAIFLGVAAFLLHVVLMRLIGTQREQIGVLKAFGYPDHRLALHYLSIAGSIALGGAILGIGGGALLGSWLAHVYQGIYRFPFLAYALDARAVTVALALASAVMAVGRFQGDAIDYMVDTRLSLAQHQDLSVTFIEPASRAALFELAALPGVRVAEPVRIVPVQLTHGARRYRTVIQGLPPDAVLSRPRDTQLRPLVPRGDGVLLTDYLRDRLALTPGDTVQVQALDGHRHQRELRVAGFVPEPIGAQGYMALDALNRALGDGDVISGVLLGVTPGAEPALYARLDRRPWVAGVSARQAGIRSFYATMAESMRAFTWIAALLGALINVGLVYNAARISLSERGRELASLRVLGMTEGEVSALLLGELGVLVLLSLPFGFAAGWGLCWLMVQGFQSELFRVPVRLTTATYAFAGLTVLGASVFSALLVRRRIARLDMIAVLKTRE